MVHTLTTTPMQDGFRMPGEFENHAGCWLIWPERDDNWREDGKYAQIAFAEVAKAISYFEPVTMAVSARLFDTCRTVLSANIRVVEISSNDSWMRDVGPTWVIDNHGNTRGIDWQFNAWGGLYHPCDLDRAVAQKVLEIERHDRYPAPLILEGGSIHVDGEGTVLTTEQCLLNPNRNPTLTKSQIERFLCEYLNVSKVIWLGQGVPHDETSGHIDNLACFVRPQHVLLTWTDDEQDPLYEICRDAEQRLLTTVDAQGRQLYVHHIPQPVHCGSNYCVALLT